MSMYVDIEHGEIVVNPDCDGEKAKRAAVFMADLFSPGVSQVSDLDPRNWQEVHKPLAGDISPIALRKVCSTLGIEVH